MGSPSQPSPKAVTTLLLLQWTRYGGAAVPVLSVPHHHLFLQQLIYQS